MNRTMCQPDYERLTNHATDQHLYGGQHSPSGNTRSGSANEMKTEVSTCTNISTGDVYTERQEAMADLQMYYHTQTPRNLSNTFRKPKNFSGKTSRRPGSSHLSVPLSRACHA